MKFKKKKVTKHLGVVGITTENFTKDKSQHIIVSDAQFSRLLHSLDKAPSTLPNHTQLKEEISTTYRVICESIKRYNIKELNIKDYSPLLFEQGMRDRNPGIAAAEGIENILNNIQRAFTHIKDSKTRRKIANTLKKLNNFMTYTGELVGSGASQKAPRSYEQLAEPLPFPELEDEEEFEEELEEGKKKDQDNDGDIDSDDWKITRDKAIKKSMKEQEEDDEDVAATVMLPTVNITADDTEVEDEEEGEEEDDYTIEVGPISAKVIPESIKEDLKKMKQIIKPISKSVLKEDERWMQKVDKDIDKRGTEGIFHKWCDDHGYDGGCDSKCWDAAKREGGKWRGRAALAETFCKENPYR